MAHLWQSDILRAYDDTSDHHMDRGAIFYLKKRLPDKWQSNTRKFNEFCIFQHDNEHDTEECHTLNKEVERLITTDLQKSSQS
jgi:hypothetical protein